MQNVTVGSRVLTEAREWIGTPYVHQASLKAVGCDCLGLIRGVWREVLGDEPELSPPYTSTWAEVRDDEPLLDAAFRNFEPVVHGDQKPGDLLIFRMRSRAAAKHAGIRASEGSFIHALDQARVVETPFTPFWQRKVCGVFRFLDHPPHASKGNQ